MIQTIGRTLRDILRDNLPWVDRVAGVVVSAEQQGTGRAFVFPIADDVEGLKCFESGNYNDLLPNDAHKSVIFFEDVSGLSFSTWKRKYDIPTFSGTLRVVCWMNLAKMGQEPGSLYPDIAAAEIIKTLLGDNDGRHDVTIGELTNAKLILSAPRISRRDDTPFERYSATRRNDSPIDRYSVSRRDSLLYPFHAFAIEWAVSIDFCLSDLTGITLNPEICE